MIALIALAAVGLFAYGTEIRLRKRDDKWRVRWAPTVVHPDLDRASRLGTTREPARRGAIRDRDGAALVTERPVVRVGVVAGQVKRPRQTAAAIDGVELVAGTDQLAPSKEFARAVLGTVGPASAEQLKKLGAGYAPGDEAGQWGLEAAYEKQLAGTAERKVVIR